MTEKETVFTFSELNIPEVESEVYVGDKIKIDRIVNKEIVIYKYKIEPSKYQGGYDKCLYLQIKYQDEFRVLWGGYKYLLERISLVLKNNFPLRTTIIKIDSGYKFS